MPLSNITGEAYYICEQHFVDAINVVSKRFPCKNQIYSDSTLLSWNGLLVSHQSFKVVNNVVIFDNDAPLTIGDELCIFYTLG